MLNYKGQNCPYNPHVTCQESYCQGCAIYLHYRTYGTTETTKVAKVKIVLIAGCFDPIHLGHFDHIKKAAALGDYLIIVTHNDSAVIEKKKYCAQTLAVRKAVLQGLLLLWHINGAVFTAKEDYMTDKIYQDGIGETLKFFKPNIFAKGGDRTVSNMPQSEIDACKEIGCEIRYGIGDLLDSSSAIMAKAKK